DRPRRRRRTAAEVAAREAAAEEERQREAAEAAIAEVPLKLEPPEPKPSLEERAAALFVEPAATREPGLSEASAGGSDATEVEPEAPREARTDFIPPRIQRPAPARLKPVASAAPGAAPAPPRPIASAAPGEVVDDRRRDKKKRKKGKK